MFECPCAAKARRTRTLSYMRRVALIAVAICAVLAAASPILLGRSSTGSSTPSSSATFSADTYRQNLLACLGESTHEEAIDCVDRVVEALPADLDIAEAVLTTKKAFAGNLVVQCHEGMHALGRGLALVITAQPDLALGELWESCGQGFLHGVFENLPLERTDAAEDAFNYCYRPEFMKTTSYRGNCLHSAGHSIYKAHAADLESAGWDCYFPGKAVVGADGLGESESCLSGIYMSYIDERFRTAKPLPSDVRWDDVLPHCATSPAPGVCSANFDLAIRSGGPQTRSQLQWCYETADEAWLCLHKLAVSQGLNLLTQGDARKEGGDWRICTDGIRGDAVWAKDATYTVHTCVEGFLKAVMTHGVARAEQEKVVCALIPVAACPRIVARGLTGRPTPESTS